MNNIRNDEEFGARFLKLIENVQPVSRNKLIEELSSIVLNSPDLIDFLKAEDFHEDPLFKGSSLFGDALITYKQKWNIEENYLFQDLSTEVSRIVVASIRKNQ